MDHTVDEQVEALFERVKQEQGRLDTLVNNVWGGYENMEKYDVPLWEQPLWRWDAMFDAGARPHFVASRFAIPLLLPQHQGLIVNTTYLWLEIYTEESDHLTHNFHHHPVATWAIVLTLLIVHTLCYAFVFRHLKTYRIYSLTLSQVIREMVSSYPFLPHWLPWSRWVNAP